MSLAILLYACLSPPPLSEAAVEPLEACEAPGPDGRELFTRTWQQLDPRSHAGDGLGPEYNAASCVACHSLGGVGGAGPRARDVLMVIEGDRVEVVHTHGVEFLGLLAIKGLGLRGSAGFEGAMSFPVQVRRQTPALFGAGLIDRIPGAELRVLEATGDPDHPEITGRLALDAHDRIGRFGWKGQIHDLATFVETACANELGLQTTAVDQPGPVAPGPDLTDRELEALIGFVAEIPRPRRVSAPGSEAGRQRFHDLGCGACHVETVAGVEGLYSDLLLHDLGEDLADGASGYGIVDPPEGVAREWRTPPLWGLRDSAPYLHDGRAPTVKQAIERHGGEADRVIDAWNASSSGEQAQVLAFLDGLVAP